MKRKIIVLSITAALLLTGCGKSENKKDKSSKASKVNIMTEEENEAQRKMEEAMPSISFSYDPDDNIESIENREYHSRVETAQLIMEALEKNPRKNVGKELFPKGRDKFDTSADNFQIYLSFMKMIEIKVGDKQYNANLITIGRKKGKYFADIYKNAENGDPFDSVLIDGPLEFDSSYIPKIVEYIGYNMGDSK